LPPVSNNHLAGDPTRIVAGKKSDGWGNVLRLADSAERSLPVLLLANCSLAET
jgi:hypothetical protein